MTTSNPTVQDSVGQLAKRVADLEEIVAEQQATIEDQQETIEEQAEEIEELRDDNARHARNLAEAKQRVSELESRVDDLEDGADPKGSSTEDTDTDDSVTPKTSLEQTVALPQGMIDEESANVQRAMFVASDVLDYTTSVPAGRAIKSGELGRVLKAGTDCRGHSQTVDRVIEILDDFGGDDVTVVKRRGERRVVFEEDLCRRLSELSREASDASHGVVRRQEV